jgi:AraC-like DNA-binding protein
MIQYYDWLPHFETIEGVSSISNELMLFSLSDIKSYVKTKNPFHPETISSPHKFNFFMFIHHKSGSVSFDIDLNHYELTKPGNMIRVLPGQILSRVTSDKEFDADVIILSKNFIDEMLIYVNGNVPLSFDKSASMIVECSESDNNIGEVLDKTVRRILRDEFDNPFKSKIIQHLMMALFYASDHHRAVTNERPRTNADALSREFLALVKENFKTQRQLQFYADKMCITPRYLSRVVKESTQFSAAEWIERLVVLEARALLKSTNMTIQQISDELNFSTQTFFGKYFKRRVGLSPKEYRREG